MRMLRYHRNSLIYAFFTLCAFVIETNGYIWRDPPHARDLQSGHQFGYQNGHQTQSQSTKIEVKQEDGYSRLPTALKPTRQRVRIQPMIGGNFSTVGYTEINFDVLESTNSIVFHMLDIITKNNTIKVIDKDDPTVSLQFVSHQFDISRQVYIGTLVDALIVGHSYTISMEYEGFLNENLVGFYRSVYQDENGEDVFLAATQMENIDARRAFPCFDEPAFKIIFDIELGRDSSLNSLSNMPKYRSYEDSTQPGLIWDIYNSTLPMSSYIIAFLVSDFVQINATTADGLHLIRVWARKEAINDASYAMLHAPAILSFYEEYTDVLFPLEKQDMAAIPDFWAGAMENWGLVTFREVYLLYNPQESSASSKYRVDEVIAHEYAHMWFGDLVTMEWWPDLWLNEGFANYMMFIGANEVGPDYDALNHYTIQEVHPSFETDLSDSSAPIELTPWKGASIIRMMKYFLTEETFLAAVTNYLNANAYGNVKPDDLWAAMDARAISDGTLNSSLTVKEIMDTYILQWGFPVLNVTINGDGSAKLTQERFLRVIDQISTDTIDYKWWIPITWTGQSSPEFNQRGVKDWMGPTEASKTIHGLPATSEWILFNIDQSFYHRVNYDENNWLGLVSQLKSDHSIVSVYTRTQLIDDVMQLARAIPGYVPYSLALELNEYLSAETEYTCWFAGLDNLEYLEQMFTNTTSYAHLKDYILELLIPFYDYIGLADSLSDTYLHQISRSMFVSWTCHFEYPNCVTNSTSLYTQWMQTPDNNPISPNLRSGVYCTAVAIGDEAEYDFALDRYLNTKLDDEKEYLLYAMGCSRHSDILISYLNLTFIDPHSPVKFQDDFQVWNSVSENDYGNAVAWDYLNQYWDQMAQYYGSYDPLASRAATVTREWNTQPELEELEEFRQLREDDLGLSISKIDAAIKTIKDNMNWMDNYYDVISQWLIENDH